MPKQQEIDHHYFDIRRPTLGGLLGWTDAEVVMWAQQLLKIHGECVIYHESPEHAVAEILIPQKVWFTPERMTLWTEIEQALCNAWDAAENYQLDTKPIYLEINSILQRYGSSLDIVKIESLN